MVKQKQERELLTRMVGILTKLSRHGRNQNLKIRIEGHEMQESNCSQSARKRGHVLMQWFSNITYAGITWGCTPDQINYDLWGWDVASVFLNLLGGANMQTSFRSNV